MLERRGSFITTVERTFIHYLGVLGEFDMKQGEQAQCVGFFGAQKPHLHKYQPTVL